MTHPICIFGHDQYTDKISVTNENDKFNLLNKDRYYTQGLRIAMNFRDDSFISITQEINTPSDTLNPPSSLPPYTDLPYSSALYIGVGQGFVFDRSGRRDVMLAIEAKLGIIGPSAGGETVQNKFHRFIDTAEAVGWGTQLPDEFIFNLDIELRRRFEIIGIESERWDIVARTALLLGTLRTEFLFGTQLRYGEHLKETWGHSFLRHSTSYDPNCTLPEHLNEGLNYWLFADSQVEVVSRNYATDGTNFRTSRAVKREPIVMQASFGLNLQFKEWSFSSFLAARTREFETQDEIHTFGGIKIGVIY